MRSSKKPFRSSLFPVNGFGAANFNSMGLCVNGSEGKIGFMFGLKIGDMSGGMVWVASGFVGVFGLASVLSMSIVSIFKGLFVWAWADTFLFNKILKRFLTGSDSSGAV